MAENEANLTAGKKPKAEGATVGTTKVKGLDVPFAATDNLPDGVDEETRLFHGIHPESLERLAVTLDGLKAEFGDKEGEEKYLKIAGIAGGSVFFNPKAEATNYRPPLGIAGLKGKNKESVAAILAAKE